MAQTTNMKETSEQQHCTDLNFISLVAALLQ